ncbi:MULTISPECIES: molybdate ABC transporter substrate-binding protein [Bacillus]|uniref:molybdate ABC transporter substrate-binding protein n=1 Tax=Bacillus TaxID=1386 RepID=UPI00084A86F7|nr:MULTISPECIES: molybdate ABC transporter substrate-binding protein [Bacillus]OEC79372.1 molybdate ABC transporter substrate-binding protein [Bacillus halotolerans]PLR91270.1 molybdate ABC transporter substrate-binding protein [Bacillus halotolerans]UZD50821.1 molybdate ABC transporter substrate-binding protein [Bacillus halotolerans]WEY44476.1 molybdate ABC transporter substrate-binding protein [Bacillus sp. B28]
MFKKYFILTAALTVFLLAAGCSASQSSSDNEKKVTLTVSAAASAQNALEEIQKNYEKTHHNITIQDNFGSSGALQKQISQGAGADLFFSAAEDKFQKLVDDGDIAKKDSTHLVGNEIVLVVPKDGDSPVTGFDNLTDSEKIALGTPESVPAGAYGKESLTKLSLWDKVKDKIVYGKDVRQVLSYVETGNVDAGAVYKTDALISKKVKIVDEAKADTHSPIVYPLGIVKDTKHHKEAKEFYDYLQTDEAMKVFEKYGFTAE